MGSYESKIYSFTNFEYVKEAVSSAEEGLIIKM